VKIAQGPFRGLIPLQKCHASGRGLLGSTAGDVAATNLGEYPEDRASHAPSAEQVALTRVQADRCLKVIREMPKMRSKVAYLKFHEEWANREIAEYLEISAGTVGKHVSDARADLKTALPEMTFIDDPDGETDADGDEAP
jgi:DNA-directed RNA polymerase specialized sigma24 family protein